MSADAAPSPNWLRIWRLFRAPQFGGKWQAWVAILVVVGLTGAMTAAAFRPKADADIPLVSVEFLTLMTYLIYMLLGPINNVWRSLPSSAKERKTTIWLYVSVVPLLLLSCSVGLTLIICELAFKANITYRATAIFGVQGLILQTFVLLIVLCANWPDSLSWFWTMSQRQLRDWLLAFTFIVITMIGTLEGRAIILVKNIGLPSTILTILLCIALLPVTRRFVRIDVPISDGSFALPATISRLQLRGWRGHLLKQALMTTAIVAFVTLSFALGTMILPSEPTSPRATFALHPVLTDGLAVALVPVMMGIFVASVGLQYMMRQRRLLLSLPRGGMLLTLTPAFNATLAMVLTAAMLPVLTKGGTDWLTYVLPSIAIGAAMVYILLALNLRATSYGDVMLAGVAAGFPTGIIGVLLGLSHDHEHRVTDVIKCYFWVITIGALVVAVLALLACRWLIRRSRKPYRPWPLTHSRWRGA